MKTPKELKEWRQQLRMGKTVHIITGFDPVGFKGTPHHVPTHGHIEAMMNHMGWDNLTYREHQINNARNYAQRAVEYANMLHKRDKVL